MRHFLSHGHVFKRVNNTINIVVFKSKSHHDNSGRNNNDSAIKKYFMCTFSEIQLSEKLIWESSGIARVTIWSYYANFSVFIDRKSDRSVKK